MIVETFPRMMSRAACHEYLSPCCLLFEIFPRSSSRMNRCAHLYQLLDSFLKSLTTNLHACFGILAKILHALCTCGFLDSHHMMLSLKKLVIVRLFCLLDSFFSPNEKSDDFSWVLILGSFLSGMDDTFPRMTNRMICHEYCILTKSDSPRFWRLDWSWYGCYTASVAVLVLWWLRLVVFLKHERLLHNFLLIKFRLEIFFSYSFSCLLVLLFGFFDCLFF